MLNKQLNHNNKLSFLSLGLLTLFAVVVIQACDLNSIEQAKNSICADDTTLSDIFNEYGVCAASDDENAPNIETIKTGEEVLSWNLIEGAVKYIIERSTDPNGVYTTVVETQAAETADGIRIFISRLLITSETYYYRVRACIDEECTNSVNSIPVAVKPATIKGQVLEGDTLSWTAVIGADSYVIQVKNGEEYEELKTIEFETTVEVEAGNIYRIKACLTIDGTQDCTVYSADIQESEDIEDSGDVEDSEDIEDNGDVEDENKVPLQEIGTVSLSEDNNVLSWSEIEGATQYKVEQSQFDNASDYKEIASTSASQYDVSKYRIGVTTYYYRVRACNSSDCTAVSSSIEVSPVLVRNLKLDGNILTWGAVAGATSYQLYRSPRSGAYTQYQTNNPITDTQYDLSIARITSSSYVYKIKACKNNNCTSLGNAYKEVGPKTVEASLDDYSLTLDNVEGATAYQVQKKKGTKNDYADYAGIPTVNNNKVSFIVDDAYAFYRVRACAPSESQSNDQDCTDYKEVENTGPLSTICTAKRHEPSTKDELKAFIDAEINKQGNEANLNCIDTSAITDMARLFFNSQFNGGISDWDVSKVTDMSYMFYDAKSFNGDISKWDVSKVTDMSRMFLRAKSFNGDLSRWDVSKVTNMSYIFYEAESFNGDISAWNVGKVTDMNRMFLRAKSFNGDINKWDVSKVTDMSSMFYGSGLGDNPPWWYNIEYPCIESYSPSDKSTLNAAIATEIYNQGDTANLNCIDTSKITDMSALFKDKSQFNSDISEWDVSKVTDMSYIFSHATAFNQDISGWDVGNVTDMTDMFSSSGLADNEPQWYLDFIAEHPSGRVTR